MPSERTLTDPNRKIEKYGTTVPRIHDPVELEMYMIRNGGRWKKKDGWVGEGLFFHYKRLQELLWPEEDHHEWSDLILREILQNHTTILQGGKDAGKTRGAAKFALCDYWCFPDCTLIMVSSTELRGADYRIWGDLKNMFRKARELRPDLPGKVLESKHAICTDNLQEDDVRDPRKGVVFIPCFGSNRQWLGLRQYAGIKQKRRIIIGDEVQFMAAPYVEIPSLFGKNDKCIFLGNPLGEGDPLDRFSEPKNGWGTEGVIDKTTVYDSKFGRVVVLYGPDSPNKNYPPDKPRYPYLANQLEADRVARMYGKDSARYWSLVMGVRRTGLVARRVLTIKMCEETGAFGQVAWLGEELTWLYAIDAAYGGIGGDRCVGLVLRYGKEVNGKIVIQVFPPTIIPVSVLNPDSPENQIAKFVRSECEKLGIPPSNVFFDARATLAVSLGKVWSSDVNAVEFGGSPTKRPVTMDSYILDKDTKQRRLKRCDEEYSKFVTELWFSARYAVEAGQVRELSRDIAEEGCSREWKTVKGDRMEVETKEDMKERTNKSPDLFDAFVIGVEGARRKGFQIARLASQETAVKDVIWKRELRDRVRELKSHYSLRPQNN